MPTKSEIESLLFLLDDPDPFVQKSVQNRFMELGESAVPLLDQYRTQIIGTEEREKAGKIIHRLTFDTLHSDFIELLEQGVKSRKSLETAMFTLARFGNPTLRTKEYQRKLDHFAAMIAPAIRFKLDDHKKMRYLIKFMFEDLNFRGDTEDYHNPANCYMDKVIDRRIGLPITLSLVMMFIARRLELPFFGVNMPIHFMLTYVSDKEELLIDPYDNGAIVTYDQCYFFLKKNGIEPKPGHFQIASDMGILLRCLRNMIHSYERKEDEERVNDLRKLLATAELYEG